MWAQPAVSHRSLHSAWEDRVTLWSSLAVLHLVMSASAVTCSPVVGRHRALSPWGRGDHNRTESLGLLGLAKALSSGEYHVVCAW